MSVLSTIVGATLVAAILRDIFHTLWHPGGFGGISWRIFRGVWRLSRRPWLRRRGPELAGPIALVCVVLVWTGSVIAGFALIYLPLLGSQFATGRPGGPDTDLGTAMYVSAVGLSTLGLGDIVPTSGLMRLVVPIEGLVGFVLLTAAISWVLQLYPALTRRRSLARSLTALHATGFEERLVGTPDDCDIVLLDDLRAQLAAAEVDLTQYSESYYFREKDPGLSLAATLPYVGLLVSSAERSASEPARGAGRRLRWGMDRLHDALAGHVDHASEHGVPAAYARHHGHEAITSSGSGDEPG